MLHRLTSQDAQRELTFVSVSFSQLVKNIYSFCIIRNKARTVQQWLKYFAFAIFQ